MGHDTPRTGAALRRISALRRVLLRGPRARAADVLVRDLCRACWNGAVDLFRQDATAPPGTYGQERNRLHGLVQDVVWRAGHARRMAAYAKSSGAVPARAESPREPFRATFLLEGVNASGGVLSVMQLMGGLRALGVEATVVVRSPRSYDPELCRAITPVFFKNDSELIRKFPPCDVAVATYWPTMHLLAECFLARPNFAPAYFVQDFEPDFYPESDWLTRRAVLDTYRMTPFCFAKTPWICEKVQEAGGIIELVPPGVDLDLFLPRPALRDPEQKPVVLMMVRPSTPQRGLDTLRNTLSKLAASGAAASVEFQAFGCPPEELAGLGLPVPVTARGVLPNAALPQVYLDAFLFLETSHFHGFGRTVAEAMACGTPCVLTDSGGVRLFAGHEKNCLMAEPGDADRLADHVLRLISRPAERARLAERCRPSILPFDLRRSAEQTLDFLRRAASGASGPRPQGR